MLKERARLIGLLAKMADLVLVVLSFFSAYWLCSIWAELQPVHNYFWVLTVTLPVGYVQMVRYGFYSSFRRVPIFEIITRLFNVHLAGGTAGAAVIFLIYPHEYSRCLYFAFVILSFVFLSIEKSFTRFLLGLARRRGFNYRNILVVGVGQRAQQFMKMLDEYREWGLRVIGFISDDHEETGHIGSSLPVLGHIDDILEICKSRPVDEVVFCLPNAQVHQLEAERNLADLETLGVTVRMVLDLFELPNTRRELEFFHEEVPILTFRSRAFDAQQSVLKRLMDLTGSLLGLAVTILVLPAITLAIKLDSKGPIFSAKFV